MNKPHLTQPCHARVPLEVRLQVLAAIDYAPGQSIRDRIKHVADKTFTDPLTQRTWRFTWRTIETWRARFNKHGVTAMDQKTRADKNTYRKIQVNELAEAITDIVTHLRPNKSGVVPKIALYRRLLEKNYFCRHQLSQTSFYRMVRENNLLDQEKTEKLRLSFAMQFSNELWQADMT